MKVKEIVNPILYVLLLMMVSRTLAAQREKSEYEKIKDRCGPDVNDIMKALDPNIDEIFVESPCSTASLTKNPGQPSCKTHDHYSESAWQRVIALGLLDGTQVCVPRSPNDCQCMMKQNNQYRWFDKNKRKGWRDCSTPLTELRFSGTK